MGRAAALGPSLFVLYLLRLNKWRKSVPAWLYNYYKELQRGLRSLAVNLKGGVAVRFTVKD